MNKPSRLKTNLLQQNVYILETLPSARADFPSSSPLCFLSVDEVVADNGIKLVTTENEYPHTQESIDSYIPGSDYHNCLVDQLNNPPKHNIGDVSALQKLSGMTYEQLEDLLSNVKAALSEADSQVSSGQNDSAPATTTINEGDNKNE